MRVAPVLKKYHRDEVLIYCASPEEKIHWINEQRISDYIKFRKNDPICAFHGSPEWIIEKGTEYVEWLRDQEERTIWPHLLKSFESMVEQYTTLVLTVPCIMWLKPKMKRT